MIPARPILATAMLVVLAMTACGGGSTGTSQDPAPPVASPVRPSPAAELRRLERRFDARLGVYAIDDELIARAAAAAVAALQ